MLKNYFVRHMNIPLFASIGLLVPLLLTACGTTNSSALARSTDDPTTLLNSHSFVLNTHAQPTLKLLGDVTRVVVRVGNTPIINVRVIVHHYRSNRMPIINYNQNRDRTVHTINEKLSVHANSNGNSDSIEFNILVPRHTNLQITTKVGNIEVNGVSGQMVLATSTGSITATQVQISRQSSFSVNVGSITFDGYLAHGGTYNMQSRIGSIDATLRGNTPLQVDAQTDIGTVNSDLPTIEASGTSAHGTIGNSPDAHITLTSHIGSISLQQS